MVPVNTFVYFLIKFIYLFVGKYFPDIPRQDGTILCIIYISVVSGAFWKYLVHDIF
jgi:hypothetical protein